MAKISNRTIKIYNSILNTKIWAGQGWTTANEDSAIEDLPKIETINSSNYKQFLESFDYAISNIVEYHESGYKDDDGDYREDDESYDEDDSSYEVKSNKRIENVAKKIQRKFLLFKKSIKKDF